LVTLSPTHFPHGKDEPPWRANQFGHEYRDDAAAAGVEAVEDMAGYFATGGREKYSNPKDPYHLNAEGNAWVAEMTRRWMTVSRGR
jgi:hypothetical protein